MMRHAPRGTVNGKSEKKWHVAQLTGKKQGVKTDS